MSEQGFGVGLQPVVTKRSRRIAFVVTGLTPLALAGLVAAAWFGGGRATPDIYVADAPRPSSASRATADAPAGTGSPNASSRGSPRPTLAPTPVSTPQPERVAMADFGYEVAHDPSAVGRPVATQGGRVVVFRSGGWLAPDGVVAVGVGTAFQKARIFGSDSSIRVHGNTLTELERDFRVKSRDRIVSNVAIRVDGVPARLLAVESFPPEIRSVVLVVHERRSYVIAAWGFSSLYPGNLTNATRSGLADFLQRFRFLSGSASAER